MARKALLIGLNRYPDPANCLRGCLNDVGQIRAVLRHRFGFRSDEIRLLTDSRATTSAIRRGLSWLVGGSKRGDVLVFHYSGHGSQVPDREHDEPSDGLDEIICPYDLDWNDPFTDDELGRIASQVAPGVNLTLILDCCHSGTGLREGLPGSRLPEGAIPRWISPPPGLLGRRDTAPCAMARVTLDRRFRAFGSRAAQAGAILLAGCRDDQVSADAYIDGAYHGAFTYFLCHALVTSSFACTYRVLAREIRRLLHSHQFDQEPQLEGRRELLGLAAFEPVGAETTQADPTRARGQCRR